MSHSHNAVTLATSELRQTTSNEYDTNMTDGSIISGFGLRHADGSLPAVRQPTTLECFSVN